MKKYIKLILNVILRSTSLYKIKFTTNHILAFHRVVEPNELSKLGLRTYEISTRRFIEIINIYISEGYTFCSLDEFMKNKNSKKKQVVFTFDDGYSDIIDNILPIIKEYEIPITVYCTPNYLNNSRLKWDYLTEFIITEAVNFDEIFNFLNIAPERPSYEINQSEAYQMVKDKLKILNTLSEFHKIESFISNFGQKYERKIQNILLNENQLKKLALEGMVTVGSHSMNHFVMTRLSDHELEFELTHSKHILEKIIGKSINYFSFPYGACETGELAAAKAAGYVTAVSTNGRNVRRFRLECEYSLPRHVVKNDDRDSKFFSIMNGFRGF